MVYELTSSLFGRNRADVTHHFKPEIPFVFFSFKVICLCVCTCGPECRCPWRPGLQPAVVRVTGGYELLDTGAGNQT